MGEPFALQVLRTAGAGKDIYLCGHSLGGGLASIVALTLPDRSFVDRAAGVQHSCLAQSSSCMTSTTVHIEHNPACMHPGPCS